MRRKVVRKTKTTGAQDDKKLQGALKKLNVQPIPGVEEVNMFREDGNVLHFSAPKGVSRDNNLVSTFAGGDVLRGLPMRDLYAFRRDIRLVAHITDFFPNL